MKNVYEYLKEDEARLKQFMSKVEAARPGKAGRPHGKGKAPYSNKATGGKMAK